jgi:hypothetical protein
VLGEEEEAELHLHRMGWEGDLAAAWNTEDSWFDTRQRKEIFPFSEIFN